MPTSVPASNDENVPAMMNPQLEMMLPVFSRATVTPLTAPWRFCSSSMRVMMKML